MYVRSLRLDLVTGQLDALDGLAGVSLAAGSAAEALRLLTVADREPARLDARPFAADREVDRAATRTGAEAALGSLDAAAVVDDAAGQSLGEVVEQLL